MDMRNDSHFPSVIEQSMEMDPEVLRAQRMQEIKDLAEWRSRRLIAYKEWSDPKKREAKKAAYEKDMEDGKAKLADIIKDEKFHEKFQETFGVMNGKSTFQIKEIANESPLQRETNPWYKRISKFIKFP